MTNESHFLQAILATPGDAALRLVYADWLEERADPECARRAEYLRVECELDALPPKGPKTRRLRARLKELRQLVGDDWWRQLDYAKVDYCVQFAYRCPQRWDMLSPTGDPAVRHCDECQHKVYYCQTSGEAERRADAGQCVAIDSRRVRLPLSVLRTARPPGRLLGRVTPRVRARPPLDKRGTGAE